MMLEPVGAADHGGEVTEVAGRLDIEYRFAYGIQYERFFRELRDDMRILGLKCPKCGAVLLPPRPYCGFCYTPVDEWVELSDSGTIIAHTVVHVPFAGQPAEPPYIFAFIMLDGADVQLPHILSEVEPAAVRTGMRVKAVWAEHRKGNLHDIKYFRPEEGGKPGEGTTQEQ
jgi:uncharacterized OB-fold protein